MDVDSIRIAGCSVCCSASKEEYFEFDDCAFVVIEIAIIGSWEDGDDSWKLFSTWPFVHFESFSLRLMGSDDGDDLVALEEPLRQFAPEKVRTSSHIIMLHHSLAVTVLIVHWICPHQVAEKPSLRDLSKAVYLTDVVELSQHSLTVFN